ncbi:MULTISPECIES: CHAT domain-containing protein [unclassified Tolypothrix]|uniref:CHAT domain-containing protein n=1 Tax=unclassified Tolypothrix TaxID=2649714 RepID=UPI0006934F0B|nr:MULTISPECIES: CHAT domain-containing protein [unclassified Tolypothrix]MBE9082316.1 CHAT domain-containing protein [Tolypothrix sp. LEGE 11397]UYD30740.1 CHAT domain-containing protein [Tolypothrix sp. PCC 7712]BAY95711.1 TPR repeat-containing protein [Microchaete diplosiphon NIES-3275]
MFGSCGLNLKLRLFPSKAVAQTVVYQKTKADQLLEKGKKDFDSSEFSKALESWKQSLNLYREIGDSQGEAISMGNLGRVYHELGDYRTAIDYHQNYLDITKKIGDHKGEAASLNNLGSTYASLGDYNKAISNYTESLAIARNIKDSQGEAVSLNNLGSTYASLGDYNKAIYYQQQYQNVYQIQSLAVVNNSGKVIAIASQQQYQNGNGYQQQSQQQSIAVTSVSSSSSQLQSSSIAIAGNSSTAIAISYQQQYPNGYQQQSLAVAGDYSKAINYYNKSLEFNKKIGNKLGEVASLTGLGDAYLKKGDHGTAIRYISQSLDIAKKIGDIQGEASSLLVLGNISLQTEDYKKAIDSFNQSLNIYRKIGNRKGEAQSQENLGNAYLKKGEYDKAVNLLQISLAITKKIGYRPGEASSLNNLGKALFLSGKFADAEKYLNQAIETLEAIRGLLGNQENWKISIFEQQAQTYQLLQQVLVAQQRPQKALVIAEQGRNRVLVEILFRRKYRELDTLMIPPPLTIEEIQKIAREQKSTLIEYSVTLDKIFIWVIPPRGKIQFRFVNIPKDISLKEQVKVSREFIGVRGSNNHHSTSTVGSFNTRLRQLHQILIEPIADLLPQDETQRVIFIPHQELFLVPFVALQNEKNEYLIEKHTILTAPSIQALSLTQKDKQAENNQNTSVLPRGESALIVGNPTMPKEGVGKDLKPLDPLPGAKVEAEKIAEMLDTKALIGDQATESAIVQKMASAKLIHFATHGLLDSINAIGYPGAIALAPSSKDDGFLTTSEIMEHFGLPKKSPLQAELVVLSACDTGRGDIKGEGVIGLSHAFMASGVPTLVVSLWTVPDSDTVKLMTDFYTNIDKRKFDKATAMRQAMLSMLRDNNGNPDPKAWAAFTVIGKAE